MTETKILQNGKEITYNHTERLITYKDGRMEHKYKLFKTTNWGINQVTNFMLKVLKNDS